MEKKPLTHCLNEIQVQVATNPERVALFKDDLAESFDEYILHDIVEELAMRLIEGKFIDIKESTDGTNIIKRARLVFVDPNLTDEETREKLGI